MDENQNESVQPKRYVGQKEVASSAVSPVKHRDTIEMTDLEYADGSKDTMPSKLFAASVTEAPSDLTAVRNSTVDAIAQELLIVLLSWGIRLDDVPYCSQLMSFKLTESVNQALRAAASKQWGKSTFDLNLVDVDKVLLDKVTVGDILNGQ